MFKLFRNNEAFTRSSQNGNSHVCEQPIVPAKGGTLMEACQARDVGITRSQCSSHAGYNGVAFHSLFKCSEEQ